MDLTAVVLLLGCAALIYFKSGKLVQILSDWAEERWPLYAYHHSRHHPPAKIRAFIDFVKEIAADEASMPVKRTG